MKDNDEEKDPQNPSTQEDNQRIGPDQPVKMRRGERKETFLVWKNAGYSRRLVCYSKKYDKCN